ncbi:MAG: hypothetical protein N2561_06420 [Bacteroidetes bacterium]|nr:hypothetical protein [Rhodothermia bacterium]MCS7154688.1 hypothetical protein [Bacteroidota bacterium]MCX7907155.1 hypothetical protein [Bacteroidota bacterium]MDW8137481.1 hypothetical protein [Bacteroidota bacterium]MDW8285565.1 hypothetical protein [Bacteroidota bacterium]
MKRTLWAIRYRALLEQARQFPAPSAPDQALERFWSQTLPSSVGHTLWVGHWAKRLWYWAAAAAVAFWVLAWMAARQGHEFDWSWNGWESFTRVELIMLSSSEPLTADAVGPILLESASTEEPSP